MHKLLMAFAALVITATACTPEQIALWVHSSPEQQQAFSEHLVREAAGEYSVNPDLLLSILRCESGLNPTAQNQGRDKASGLGQHLLRYWPGRAAAVGAPDAPWWDAQTNARVSAWMLSTQGTRPWSSSRFCWR